MAARWRWRISLVIGICAGISLSYMVLLQALPARTPRTHSLASVEPANGEQPSEVVRRIEARQEERKQRLREFCEKHKRSTGRPLNLSHLRFVLPLIAKERKLLYCAIPKTGSTQWRKNLARAEGREREVLGSPHRFWFGGLSRQAVSRKLDDLFKFIIVRDPFARLLSAYRNKFFFRPKFWYHYEKFSRQIKDAFRRNGSHVGDVTFKEFLHYITLLSGYKQNNHWMPYEDLCLLCDIDYDFIGHLETISEECQYILEKAGISNLTFCPDRRESSTDAEIKTFYAQIPRDTILKIRKIYGNDFEMHGYPFPGKLESRVEQFTWNEVWEQEIP